MGLSGLVDSGAMANLVSRSAIAAYKDRLQISAGPSLALLDGKSLTTYGYCNVLVHTKDSLGVTHTQRHQFAIVDLKEPRLILGFPWLRDTNPCIDWKAGLWRHRVTRKNLSVSNSRAELGSVQFAMVLQMGPEPASLESQQRSSSAEDGAAGPVPNYAEEYPDLFHPDKLDALPEHSALEHRIELEGDAPPPWGPIYPLSAKELEVLREYLHDAEAKGWIRPSTSPAGAPILFVPKKGGKLRLCVDYRALNRLTRKDRTPLPLISEILDRLSSAEIYTKLDLKDAYHRIRIRAGDEWKTAFRTRYGHFEYLVMPFGLANAPATFQTYINRALAGLVDVICIVYLDDILIYSSDPATHAHDVRLVLERLRQWNLYINPDKCEFHTKSVTFLGFVVSDQGIAMEPERVEAVTKWPLPRSVHDIQVFLGFTGFYRRFIRNYAKVVAPLTDLLRGDARGSLELPPAAAEAFNQLLQEFTRAPILRHFDPALDIRVETDASGTAVGAVLSQRHSDRWHPVAFRSRKLSPQEARYDTADVELLAIVDAFRTWRHYLAYTQTSVLVLTDHFNLQYFQTKKKPNARQLRWSDELAGFDFYIKFRPGKENPADALSRMPGEAESSEGAPDKLSALLASRLQAGMGQARDENGEMVAREQRMIAQISLRATRRGNHGPAVRGGSADAATAHRQPCRPQSESLRRGRRPHSPDREGVRSAGSTTAVKGPRGLEAATRSVAACELLKPGAGATGCKLYVPRGTIGYIAPETALEGPEWSVTLREAQQKDAFVTKGTWKKRRTRGATAGKPHWEMGSDSLLRFKGRVYVPAEPRLRRELIQAHHDVETAGHPGVTKTRKLLSRGYYWDSQPRDVKAYTNTCLVCQRTKPRHHRPYGLLGALPQPVRPYQEISFDFITGLPTSIDPRTTRPCNAILVVVDRFTKHATYIATTKQLTASGLADLMFYYIFRQFGLPEGIVSDRGSLFTSNFWTQLCRHLAVKRRLSTAYHPQTDGQTERQNQNVEHYLRVFCQRDQADWAMRLSLAEFVYNTSWHSTIKTTPAEALFGFVPRTPADAPEEQRGSCAPAADQRMEELQTSRARIQELLSSARMAYEKWYNAGRQQQHFNEGDWVLLSTRNLKQLRPSSKLADKYIGPFQVTAVVGDSKLAYKLELPQRYRIHNTFPVSSLEAYRGRADEATEQRDNPDLEADQTYEVEAIIGHRGPKKNRQFLIRWKGYTSEDDTWEPRENIDDGPLLKEYEEQVK